MVLWDFHVYLPSYRCRILQVINHFILRYEVIYLTKSLLMLVDKMPTESWCICGEFTLHRCNTEDWNLYKEAVFAGKYLHIFQRIYVPIFQSIWIHRLWGSRKNAHPTIRQISTSKLPPQPSWFNRWPIMKHVMSLICEG